MKKRKLDSSIELKDNETEAQLPKQKIVPAPSEQEISQFFSSISKSSSKPAVLSLVDEYSDEYIPKTLKLNFPCILPDLASEENRQLSYDELIKRSKEIDLSVTKEQCDNVEAETR